ncbi:MAG: hypothetical protein ABI536_04660 [Gallionella sp.]
MGVANAEEAQNINDKMEKYFDIFIILFPKVRDAKLPQVCASVCTPVHLPENSDFQFQTLPVNG